MISKALDLAKDEPAETYSSSPHLRSDLNIPETANGRIGSGGAAREDRKEREPRSGGRSSGSGRRESGSRESTGRESGQREGGQRPSRQRRRTRGGTPGEGAGVSGEAATTTESASTGSAASTAPSETSGPGTEGGSDRPRRRRRRRGGQTSGGAEGNGETVSNTSE